MPDRDPRESQDLSDYETDDAYNTLDGDPGDDPLDRGVAPPQRWSRAIRNSAEEPSLDEQLAEEEPDTTWDEYEDDDEEENEAEAAEHVVEDDE